MFKGKNKCQRCEGKLKEEFSFCPYCGLDLRNPEGDMRDYGKLGRNDFSAGAPVVGGLGGLGISDKLLNSIFNNLMKSFEKQMNNASSPDVQSFPNGVRIKFEVPNNSPPKKKPVKKVITQEQVKRMEGLPRVEAKSNVRRLSDRVIYDLSAPGVESPEDVFVSKLEEGYEVKAISKKKVYVNNLPVSLPLKGLHLHPEGLTVEFGLGE